MTVFTFMISLSVAKETSAIFLKVVIAPVGSGQGIGSVSSFISAQYFPPTNKVPQCTAAGIANNTLYYYELEKSTQMLQNTLSCIKTHYCF